MDAHPASAAAGPRLPAVWTIPAHLPFLDALVAGLFARHGRDPLTLAGITILLPSRRACRSLRDAFLRASGGAPMLLPRMAPLGDIDEEEIELGGGLAAGESLDLPPAIAPLRRQLLLARLIRSWGERRDGGAMLPGHALALARDLARLIDQAHTERVPFARLKDLAPAELAQHWEITLDFLAIVTEHWPRLLEIEGALDPADRRNRLIAAQLAAWRARPPAEPVIAAGFGSAIPAAAELIGLIAMLPCGAVVLPGVDGAAEPALWDAIRADPTHPQQPLAELLDRLGLAHDGLPAWPAPGLAPGLAPGRPARAALIRELMRPAAVSHQWRSLGTMPAAAIEGLARLDLAGPQEEAGAVALLLRRQLERPGATAMLVTPDRGLARRVAGELRRWSIEIDDSAGIPLNHTPPGVLLRLLAEAALEHLAPVPLLALLKHPLCTAGLAPARFRDEVRTLERLCLRGPRPAPGLAGLSAVAAGKGGCLALVERLERVLGPFLALAEAPEATLEALLAAHVAAAEALAATDREAGPARLWALEAGESLAGFVAELAGAAAGFPPIAGADYPVLLETALAGHVVRPRWGRHPRLQILGTLEARLQSADLVVLAALNEGAWPAQGAHDPFLSRPMRRDLGLAAAEAQVGLAAQDFAAGLAAPEVVLTRALKAEGAPTVPSRWLLRLDTVLRAAGLPAPPAGAAEIQACRAWQTLLDQPAEIAPVAPPEPRPPVALRPRRLGVTEIETWMRNPYAVYARHVLRLDPLDPLDADPGAAERGSFIHEALDSFLRQGGGADPLAALEAFGRAAFGEALARPGVWAFWWPRFQRIARWFVAAEAARRPLLAGSTTECRGRLVLEGPAGPFEVTAKADRIDRLAAGGLALIDYKTGAVPAKEEIRLGVAPQLPLEAAMAEAGGFAGVPAGPVVELAFWRLSGGEEPGEEIGLADPAALARAAAAGLARLVAVFDDPATPYRARPRPDRAPRFDDYGHLARLLEWGAEGE